MKHAKTIIRLARLRGDVDNFLHLRYYGSAYICGRRDKMNGRCFGASVFRSVLTPLYCAAYIRGWCDGRLHLKMNFA